MELIINQFITLGACYGVLGIGYLAWLTSGVVSVAYSHKRRWSWARFREDLLKFILHLAALGLFVVGMNLLEWLVARMGGDIKAMMNGISVAGLAIMTLKNGADYYAKAYQNFEKFHQTRFSEDIPLELDPDAVDWDEVAEGVKGFVKEMADALTPEHTANEKQTDDNASLSDEEVAEVLEAEGRGAEINPLNRILPDGDTDGGKGWQCSKYSWYLATGITMNYAPHPDYGPCHGKAMVDYLISKLGWVECTKMDGAIFSYNSGTYGHTGVVKDAKNNIVNDANWSPLKVGTHYLNLDAVGARYACPKSMLSTNTKTEPKPQENTSTPATEPKPSTPATPTPAFKVGDTVRPLRLVDYNGRRLRQYDDNYTILQIHGNRVVLTARGQVWAAMRTEDIERV